MHIQRHSSEIGWNHFESEWSGLKNVTHFSSTWKWLIVSFELSGTEYQHHSDDKMMSRTNRDERHRENGKKKHQLTEIWDDDEEVLVDEINMNSGHFLETRTMSLFSALLSWICEQQPRSFDRCMLFFVGTFECGLCDSSRFYSAL